MSALEVRNRSERAQSWAVPFSSSAVPAVRATLTDVLRLLDIAQDVVDDARTVVTELLGNALRHARPLRDGMLHVGLQLEDDSIRIFVADGGSATLPTLLTPPQLALDGRGLSVVRNLTRSWGVHETGAGNTVFGILSLA